MKKFMSNYINDLSTNVVRTQVNDNLERVFNMEHDIVPLESNQNNQINQLPRKKGRGGARPNSGRKLGSTVRLSGADILNEIAK